MADERFDVDRLDEEDPFEIDDQAAHLFNIRIWESGTSTTCGPVTRCSIRPSPPAHWLMCAEVSGRVLVVPLAPSRSRNPRRCRPIGCYEAAPALGSQCRRDR